jgi:hypothetical protein
LWPAVRLVALVALVVGFTAPQARAQAASGATAIEPQLAEASGAARLPLLVAQAEQRRDQPAEVLELTA